MRIHPGPSVTPIALLLLAALSVGLTGCGPREAMPPATSASPSPAPPETKPDPGAPAAPAPDAPRESATAGVPAHTARPAVTPASAPVAPPSAQTPAQTLSPVPEAKSVPAASPISDPGGEVAVRAIKAGLTRVGATSCRMCHKVQFASWSESTHAKRTPPLDCESCHGPGSEYKAIAVMKDPARAKAAGLVQPGAAFCATCHKRNWNDGMLKKAHAHKA